MKLKTFPDETINRAGEIARLYKDRGMRRNTWQLRLRTNQFIELGYGFRECLLTGNGGLYLHEAKREVDCFSRAGVDYIVAKELGLEPIIYWASDMKDVEEGDIEAEQFMAEHAFISLELYGKQILHDYLLKMYGEMEILDGKIIVTQKKKDEITTVINERKFSTLRVMDEHDYVEEMERRRAPGGTKLALTYAQAIRHKGLRLSLQYIPTSNKLVSFLERKIDPNMVEESQRNADIFELTAPVGDDGTWHLDQAVVSAFFAQHGGWRSDQHGLVHCKMNFPYRLVSEYIQNLATAASSFGRKGPIEDIRSHHISKYYLDRGFSFLGEITKENSVNQLAHSKLLDEIVDLISIDGEPTEAQAAIDQAAVYVAQKIAAVSESNPMGLRYSQADIDEFVKDHLPLIHEFHKIATDINFERIMAQAKLRPNLKKYDKAFWYILKQKKKVDKFSRILQERRDSIDAFNREIDFAMFQTLYPMGSITATDEERMILYKAFAHNYMVSLSQVLPALEVRKYQPALKRVLAQ